MLICVKLSFNHARGASKVHYPQPGGLDCRSFECGDSAVVDLLFYAPPIVCGGFMCWSVFW